MFTRLKIWAAALKRDCAVLWLASKDERMPWLPKLVAGAVLAYALSPIDLIPDFIPVLGYLDDLIIVPLGIYLAFRLIPDALLLELREKAVSKNTLPRSYLGAAAVIVLWLSAAAVLFWAVAGYTGLANATIFLT